MPQFKPFRGIGLNHVHPLARGLIAAWIMNEGAGNKVFDLSRNGKEGSLIATAHFVPGKYGPAVDYDGNSDYINFGDCFAFGDGVTDKPFSIVALVYPRDATNFEILVKCIGTGASQAEFYFEISDGDQLRFVTCDNGLGARIGIKSSATLTGYQNSWIHLAGTYDGSGIEGGFKIYLNGSEITSILSNSSGSYTAMENLAIAVNSGVFLGTRWANGLVNHIYVYDRVLFAEEIAQITREPFAMFEKARIPFLIPAVPAVSPNLTDRNNYNGYTAFIQQYIKHKINGTDPWANPQGDLL